MGSAHSAESAKKGTVSFFFWVWLYLLYLDLENMSGLTAKAPGTVADVKYHDSRLSRWFNYESLIIAPRGKVSQRKVFKLMARREKVIFFAASLALLNVVLAECQRTRPWMWVAESLRHRATPVVVYRGPYQGECCKWERQPQKSLTWLPISKIYGGIFLMEKIVASRTTKQWCLHC